MGNDKKLRPDGKKGLPGGFLLFLFAMILIILAVQSLTSNKSGKVSFSYQLEHLVNLNLIKPDESHKVAQNDNLVTFTGKFRERESEDGKERFDYLTLLNKHQELVGESRHLANELDDMQKNVYDAASWFINISGATIPKNGFAVISSVYDTTDRVNSIIVKDVNLPNTLNLQSAQHKLESIKKSSSDEMIAGLGSDVILLTKLYMSPKLGIGNETYKQRLKDIERQLERSKQEEMTSSEKLSIYTIAINTLSTITDKLMMEKDGARLLALRSVRNYFETIDQFDVIDKELIKNEAILSKSRSKVADVIWFFNNKELSTRSLEKQDPEAYSQWYAKSKQEWENFSANKGLAFKAPDQPRNTVLERSFKSQEPSPNYFSYIFTILPVVLVILVLYFIFSRQMKGAGSSAMNFGKSPARLLTKETNKVTFKDVAGAEEAKEELQEIVDFLKDPQKFTSIGARIPKGVLLVGQPGTGKTLVAKAVAGEADRPFYSISGSDFVEMFVGVGASRIRDLFDQAKKNAPCIIFMDEIDAVGRHRGAGIGGGHDEREQTLNQLLVEMDGFDTKEGVILMAATNRPDILDKALLRPGRFDRRVVLDLPDVKGRYEILKVHARKIKIDESVNLMDIAKSTPGASGADLENILNEAALLAAHRGRSAVTSSEAKEACDKVRFGKERRSLEMDENEKKTTAYHESGHAIVGLSVDNADPVDKVTIIPRGFALGATHFMPKKNRLSYWKKEIVDQLAILMGGRAAEEVFIKDISSGAQHDIVQATKLARSMICEWGMSSLGTIAFEERQEAGQYLGIGGYHEKLYSDETAERIDQELKVIVEEAHKRALSIVEEKKDKLVLLAEMLMEFETLDAEDIKEIMEGSWDAEKKTQRLKIAEDLQKLPPPPPPPEEDTKKEESSDGGLPKPQQT
jgi:cell division protease FtsH